MKHSHIKNENAQFSELERTYRSATLLVFSHQERARCLVPLVRSAIQATLVRVMLVCCIVYVAMLTFSACS